ncbi:cryptochrome/photolyase family protein [Aestuariimicrobium kwangyangense]|uniref:cryptochrome/photolyase family protein n=1 Tax=Aestuariimicrobium kwangyangense TaxID=396389 RepID=UPI001FE14BCD|nr:deoxyribodipyrimidine photo-lyase [Aestuariimicrobium kwangyangense]
MSRGETSVGPAGRIAMTAMVWLRRDLRRADLPLLAAAHEHSGGAPVKVVFVLDPVFLEGAGAARTAWLAATLLALRQSYEGRLTLLEGDATEVIPRVASAGGITSVHVSTETEPGGADRDRQVARALGRVGVEWVETGSPYAVTPGRVRTKAGGPHGTFSSFARTWVEHGWRAPAEEPADLALAPDASDQGAWARVERLLRAPGAPELPPAGEVAAHERWSQFLADDLDGYSTQRDRADLAATSQLSPHLKFGVLHPRTLLADLAPRPGQGAERFRTELAWREFYADVLHHHPGSLTGDLRPALAGMAYDPDGDHVEAWRRGRTGFPLVDAGMRQLLATGWMHNRVRMVTASFLTKDLHVWWPIGAQWFLDHLVDGDLASNTHGWQWVAGTGTDAAPYFRVFNPVKQGLTHDPQGDYVRRWVPELAHLAGDLVHQPWEASDGYAHGYPTRIIDHADERREALARLEMARHA